MMKFGTSELLIIQRINHGEIYMKKFKEKKVKKLYQKKWVSIRDYEVEQAIERGGIIISHQNFKMFLTKRNLEMSKPNSKLFKSQTGGKDYRLVDFEWKPNTDGVHFFDNESEKLISLET